MICNDSPQPHNPIRSNTPSTHTTLPYPAVSNSPPAPGGITETIRQPTNPYQKLQQKAKSKSNKCRDLPSANHWASDRLLPRQDMHNTAPHSAKENKIKIISFCFAGVGGMCVRLGTINTIVLCRVMRYGRGERYHKRPAHRA